jgi:aminopeptidase N
MDVHSYARPAEARVTSLALDLRVDLRTARLAGRVSLTLDRAPHSASVILDTHALEIGGVEDVRGRPLDFTLGAPDPVLGRPLSIALPAGVDAMTVTYAASPGAAALQWLAPAQTAGRRHGFLFSQGQPILTRTWIPTQDSPSIRQTYTARIVVPPELRAVMSAECLTPDGIETPEGRAFEFRLTNPIPPYLIALAVGDLAFRPLGARSGVYAEPATIDAAAAELADVEPMIAAAESLLGPYLWGRYDVLVLPPAFPFGGMENPLVTFATPTILAGDRSLVSLIAHELAHSWSGNLVTNATWRDFWLNEGVTTYVERRIMEALHGAEHADMLAVLARHELLEEIDRLGGPSSPDTILHINLDGRDPDEGSTRIPYEKGAAFLTLLEQTVGRARFDAFLRSYVDRFAFQSIDTATFLAHLRTHLLDTGGTAAGAVPAEEARLHVHEWVFEPGLPDNAPVPRSRLLDRVTEQARAFIGGTPASQLATETWTTQEWQHFLSALPDRMTDAQLSALDAACHLTTRTNSEVLFSWLCIATVHGYRPVMPAVARFLTSQGRRKFVRPLYEELMKSEWGRDEARRIYAIARPTYHALVTSTVDPIVGWTGQVPPAITS